MSKTVLLFTTEMRPGGAERIVHDLATHLDAKRWRPVVAALDGRGEFAERIRLRGVRMADLGAYSRRDLGVVWRLRDLLREQRVDLLHTHLMHANVIGRLAARPLRLPVLSTCHIADKRSVWWHFWLDRLTAPWCRAEACVSQAALRYQQHRTGLPDSFFRLAHNGIALERFANLPSRDEARARLGLPRELPLVGVLGRLHLQKGVDVFLHALAEPPLAERRLQALVAGYGPVENSLRHFAAALGLQDRIRFLGYQDRPETFLAALDCCAVPSRWEGFGLVVVEAMAAGAPVVATSVDSIPEIVEPGVSGLLVPPEDPPALAAALARVLDDEVLGDTLRAGGRERANAFSLPRMVARYEALYGEILGHPQPAPPHSSA